jgi:adsorption protein B
MGALFWGIEVAMHEVALFAACGFLVLGLSDLAVDLVWIGRTAWRRCTVYRRFERARADTLVEPVLSGRLAIFVPAWDEADVIGDMLRAALSALDHPRYRIYVGCYPNDPDTIRAVEAVRDERIRMVIGPRDGPTTKADCLNRLWQRMIEDEWTEEVRFKAVVLHDAEDVVHSAELRIFDTLIERFALVQLPVLPLLNPHSRWIAGHYADEFAEAHGKELVVREALGAAVPSAGVGCAFSRGALEKMAMLGRDGPFDAESLTEDYELGLKLRMVGGRAAFVRMRSGEQRPLVVTREYFPATLDAAIGQKTRWMTGIALSGWDRLGWNGGLAERWMRLRDRQAVMASLLLFAGYATLLLWGAVQLRFLITGLAPRPVSPELALLLQINFAMLAWRLAMRFVFVRQAYGTAEAVRSVPRVFISNVIAMLAARRAVFRYLRIRRTGSATWDKTAHAFPAQVPAE